MPEYQESSGLSLTDDCSQRISALRDAGNNPNLMLRVAVLGGGCSGFQYKFDLDDNINDDDKTFELNGTKIIVDEISLEFLSGSVIDYKEDLEYAEYLLSKKYNY